MRGVIEVEGVRATFDGKTWSSKDTKLAAFLDGCRWRGTFQSKHGSKGSHVVQLAKDLHAKLISVEDTPTDYQDVV